MPRPERPVFIFFIFSDKILEKKNKKTISIHSEETHFNYLKPFCKLPI